MEIHLINDRILNISDEAQIFEDEHTISSVNVGRSDINDWFKSRKSIEIFDKETYVIPTANILYIKR